MFKRIIGTKDILPEEVSSWQEIEEASRRVFSLYNYKEIRPPLMEEAGLFNRSLGETAEVVQKQMFLVNSAPISNGKQEKTKQFYCLRPEATASIVRAYLENHLDKTFGFTKLYYIGPMFRLERPQKGRLREFHHIGCEAIGSLDAALDIEVISLADNLLKEYNIKDYKIQINSLGCQKDRKNLTAILGKSLMQKKEQLCVDCQQRLGRNILRVLDCKNESCREILIKLELSDDYLCPDCKMHFKQVKEGLENLKIGYNVNPYLVRGLDYYTRTVFEITHNELGSQDALGAGGRYDNLVAELGGQSTGAIGFAFGVERLLLVTRSQGHKVTSKNLVYLITLGKEARQQGLKLLAQMRQKGISADTDYEEKSLKGAMRRANDLAASQVIIIGEDEIKKGVVLLKDMATGEQSEITRDQVLRQLSGRT